jgi:hypothetical protein
MPDLRSSSSHVTPWCRPTIPKKKGKILTDVLMIRATPKTKLQPTLLAKFSVTDIKGNISVRSFAILDPGSEPTLATRSLAMKLQVSGQTVLPVEKHSEIVSYHLKALNGIVKTTDVFVVPQINLSCRKINWPLLKKNWSHLADLTLPPIDTSLVELLIGIDQVYAHTYLDVRRPVDGEVDPISLKRHVKKNVDKNCQPLFLVILVI